MLIGKVFVISCGTINTKFNRFFFAISGRFNCPIHFPAFGW